MEYSRTAVVIEDDADIAGLVEAVLEKSRVGALLRYKGTDGVASVRSHSLDRVVPDYGLPDITGLEVIGRIRSFSNVPILMLTGRGDLADTLLEAGANSVMTKPFRPRALRASVEEAPGLQHQNH
jgi:DNA-binding response OmpR family regulator